MKHTGKITLRDAIKTFKEDQDKIISPQKTLEIVKPKLKSTGMDVLANTVRIDNGRLGLPVFFSNCGIDAREIIGTKKQMGKGASVMQAEASAVMELVERYSFFSFYKNNDNIVLNTYENLVDESISFEEISKSVNDKSEDLDLSKKIFQSLPLNWTGAYNLSTDKEILIPLNWFYYINEFNGSSSGNCIEEALCQGICEIVERHVSALISRNRISTPLLELDSVKDLLVLDILKKYHISGIKLFITDFTLDLGISSIGVLAYDPKTFPTSSEIIWTAGTAPDPQKALGRALTEVAQLAGDFNSNSNYLASGLPKIKSIEGFDFVVDKHNTVKIEEIPNISNNNFRIEVENCISILSRQNMEVIIVDVTHPMLMIPSFYTIIPGTHFRERSNKTSVAMFSAKIMSENFPINVAIQKLKDMDKLLPEKYFVQFYIGKCYLDNGKNDMALSFFKKALDLNPNEEDIPSIYSYLGVCFKNMGKYLEAIEVLKKGEQIDSDRTDIHNLKGFCYFMLKKYEKAIHSFLKVIKINPSSAIDYANIASSYRDMGNRNKAIHYYKLALEIDPSIDFAIKNLNFLVS